MNGEYGKSERKMCMKKGKNGNEEGGRWKEKGNVKKEKERLCEEGKTKREKNKRKKVVIAKKKEEEKQLVRRERNTNPNPVSYLTINFSCITKILMHSKNSISQFSLPPQKKNSHRND